MPCGLCGDLDRTRLGGQGHRATRVRVVVEEDCAADEVRELIGGRWVRGDDDQLRRQSLQPLELGPSLAAASDRPERVAAMLHHHSLMGVRPVVPASAAPGARGLDPRVASHSWHCV